MLNARCCCASGCTSCATSLPEAGVPVRLHQFPCDDDVARRWQQMLELDFMDLEDIRTKGLRVCSKHFADNAYNCQFLRHDPTSRLRWNAVPDKELVMPRLTREDLEPAIVRTDEEADNTYPPKLERPFDCGSDASEQQQPKNQQWRHAMAAEQMSPTSPKCADEDRAKRCQRFCGPTGLNKTRTCMYRQRATIKRLQCQIAKAKSIKSRSAAISRLIENDIKQQSVNIRGMRWSKNDIAASIQLHHRSPAAYRMLRKQWQLPLPSESSLKRRIRQFFPSSGVCHKTLELLQLQSTVGRGLVLKRSGVLEYPNCRLVLTAAHPSGVHLRHKTHSHAVSGLKVPSPTALQGFTQMEAAFAAQPPSFILRPNVAARTLNSFSASGIAFPACEHHFAQVQQRVSRTFLHLRLHHWCRCQMRTDARSKYSALRKMKKFN